MARKRKSKKSEKVEVRLPLETKTGLAEASRRAGTTVSEFVRQLIGEAIEPVGIGLPSATRRRGFPMWSRLALGTIGVAALTLLAVAPSSATGRLEQRFEALDADRDGVISLSEFMASNSHPPSKAFFRTWFNRTDLDGDEFISFAEFHADHVQRETLVFKAMDTSGDGRIEMAELVDAKGPARAAILGMAAGVAFGRGEEAESFADDEDVPPLSAARLGLVFDRMDADRDGLISLDEYIDT